MSDQEGFGRDNRAGTLQQGDLIIAAGEFALVQETNSGVVKVSVGPRRASLSPETEVAVIFSQEDKRFRRCDKVIDAIQLSPAADEGSYIVLEHPATGTADKEHPAVGVNEPVDLDIGRKINIRGPATFPLWPRQVAQVVDGHQLRSNQFLVIGVYNEVEAEKNWEQAVMLPQTAGSGESSGDEGAEEEVVPEGAVNPDGEVRPGAEKPDLTMGKLLVIKGTDVSFYIPPTGIEVVPDEQTGEYVRDAVTLELMELCILLDESGDKRYVQGPAVVFPAPTETFVQADDSQADDNRKFRAIELNTEMGIYVKAIAPYKDEDGTQHEVGEELFITGEEQRIYFPRPEHSLIRYGDQMIHFAVAIPAGEARHVLDKETGEVELVRGPKMFLPDPRRQVVVRRVLDLKTVELLFPGNKEALRHNMELAGLDHGEADPYAEELLTKGGGRGLVFSTQAQKLASTPQDIAKMLGGIQRETTFTPPRTVTLDTKYDGAVAINVWTGYAVLVVSKTGARRVVKGPQTVLLEYDETLEAMELSTGTPKSDDHLLETVYLRVLNNKVSDQVVAETADFCAVVIDLSYRVNFEGEPEKWFDVENYVQFLTDHLRSMIRNAVKQRGVEDFYSNAISIIRDTILGDPVEGGERRGYPFEENGMRVTDIEVLDITIGDENVTKLLVDAQHQVVSQKLALDQEQRTLVLTQQREEIQQKTARAEAETKKAALALGQEVTEQQLQADTAQALANTKTAEVRRTTEIAAQETENHINEAKLARQKAQTDQELELAQSKLDQSNARLAAEVKAVTDQVGAVSPNFIAALQTHGDKELAAKLADAMGPLAILGGTNVVDVLTNLIGGSFPSVQNALASLKAGRKDPASQSSEEEPS